MSFYDNPKLRGWIYTILVFAALIVVFSIWPDCPNGSCA